jgi:outer membrane protein OmpA-like peptidoglycan-associated protein
MQILKWKLFLAERGKIVRLKILMAIITFVLIIATTSNAFAQFNGHPLITPFEGSYIEGQEVKEFDEQQLVIGKVQEDGTVMTEKIEGKITRIDYRDPDNRSSLERIRNYELAFRKAGFEIVFSCNTQDCGPEIQIATIGFYPPERYLAAFQKRTEGNVWIGVFVSAGPWTKIRIVEEKPMETDMVKITADILKTNILKDGHMAVYGIYFDTGKSDIKPESVVTIKEIAVLLQKDPSLQIYIVGHTDNVGKLKDNMELSNKRATAVITELITRFKIDASRLEAGGVGPPAPIAPNDTEEGKDLNRRVEIVKK